MTRDSHLFIHQQPGCSTVIEMLWIMFRIIKCSLKSMFWRFISLIFQSKSLISWYDPVGRIGLSFAILFKYSWSFIQPANYFVIWIDHVPVKTASLKLQYLGHHTPTVRIPADWKRSRGPFGSGNSLIPLSHVVVGSFRLQRARKAGWHLVSSLFVGIAVCPLAPILSSHLHSTFISRFRRPFIFVIATRIQTSVRSVNPPFAAIPSSVGTSVWPNVHLSCVFIDWLSSHLSLTLVLNWGLTPLWQDGSDGGAAGGHSGCSVPGGCSRGPHSGDDRPLAVALLIRLAKLGGESPHLAPLPTLVCASSGCLVSVCVRWCTCVNACARTSATGRTLPFVGGPFVVARLFPGMCAGIKGGMMGIKRKVKV